MKLVLRAALPAVLGACSAAEEPGAAVPELRVELTGASAAVTTGALADVAFWTDPRQPGDELILAAAGNGGVLMYAADGSLAGTAEDVDAAMIAVAPDFAAGGEQGPLVLGYRGSSSTIDAWRVDRAAPALRTVSQALVEVDDEVVGLCHYRSRLSGGHYLYAVTDTGLVHHYEVYEAGDGVAARLLRSIASGKGSAFCAVDPRDGMLYLSEEDTGIWRTGAEPETDPVREPVDLRAPFGALSDEVKGLAVQPAGAGRSWLVVSDAGEERLAVYSLPDPELLGFVTFDGLEEVEAIAAAGDVLALVDEEEGGVTRLKLLGRGELAAATGLTLADAAELPPAPAVVRPVLETEPVATWGDAADDPAIWLHPDDPERSLVIGTDKKRGLFVYDLDGRVLQVLEDGNLNNVDVRYGFELGGAAVDLAAASNRSTGGISVYRIDPDERQLADVAAGTLPTGFNDPYGACLYSSAASGELYVFVNEGDTGLFRQWRLYDDGTGRVAAEQVREFPVGSQAEGCVADDETGYLYIGEEERALWKYSAEPDGGSERTLIDTTEDDGRLTADIEGVALWLGEGGRGYLVVSNQGADNYAVYRREGDNAYVGHFHIVANPARGIDGASETDGLEVTSAPLGARFPSGLLVVQDGRNIAPREKQNFKYISWADVEAALDLHEDPAP